VLHWFGWRPVHSVRGGGGRGFGKPISRLGEWPLRSARTGTDAEAPNHFAGRQRRIHSGRENLGVTRPRWFRGLGALGGSTEARSLDRIAPTAQIRGSGRALGDPQTDYFGVRPGDKFTCRPIRSPLLHRGTTAANPPWAAPVEPGSWPRRYPSAKPGAASAPSRRRARGRARWRRH
jgi:hypothetical protein